MCVSDERKCIYTLSNLPRVSTPCRSLTKTFCFAIRFAAMDRSNVTTEGKPSGTKATRIDTAKVTVWATFPLYAVVIPTAKKTRAKRMAMHETITTKRPLFSYVQYSQIWAERTCDIHFDSKRTLVSTFATSEARNLT